MKTKMEKYLEYYKNNLTQDSLTAACQPERMNSFILVGF